MVPVRYFDLAQPIQRDELPLEWRLAAAPFDRNGAVKQIYLSPVSDDFAAELLDEFGDRWPPAAFTNGGGTARR
jgi:5-methylcytosine-specific restriction enzyme B